MAPSSSARNVVSPPRSVSDDTITTGIGRSRMSFSRKSSPSIRGISTSRVSTSGLCCLISSRATSGSGATATTSMSSWLSMISVIRLRTSAESSTHNTRIFFMPPASRFYSCSHLLGQGVDRLAAQAEGLGEIREVLGVACEQQAAGFEHGCKTLQNARLRGLVKVNHGVAAKYGVELFAAGPRGCHQVQGLELHDLLQYGF